MGARASHRCSFALSLASFFGAIFGFLISHLNWVGAAIEALSLSLIIADFLGKPIFSTNFLVALALSRLAESILYVHCDVKELFAFGRAVLGHASTKTGAVTHLNEFLTFLVASTLAIRLSVLFFGWFDWRNTLFIGLMAVIYSGPAGAFES